MERVSRLEFQLQGSCRYCAEPKEMQRVEQLRHFGSMYGSTNSREKCDMVKLQKNLFQNLDLKEVQKIIDDSRSEVRYLITDFPAELLASKFRENPEDEGDIYVPLYQRTLQWTPDKKSYFIESLILRIPVPPIFFCDQNGRLEIIDGSQRTRTLVSFLKDEFKLAGLETLDVLNGFSFSQLPPATQKRLNNTPIRSFILAGC